MSTCSESNGRYKYQNQPDTKVYNHISTTRQTNSNNQSTTYTKPTKQNYTNPMSRTHLIRQDGKGKAVPLQAWSGPEGSRKLKFPDYMTTAQDGSKIVSLRHRPPLPSGNAPGTHLCWRLSRPQAHSAIGRVRSTKNSNGTFWNRTSDLPICSTAP